jgi:hypothetical protein
VTYPQQISKLLAEGHDQYVPGTDMGTAVTQLLLHAPMPAAAEATMQQADGTWEVRAQQQQQLLHKLQPVCAGAGVQAHGDRLL